MSMTLYGSLPSPFVRRIRMFLDDIEYQFQAVELYDDDKRAEFAAITPIRKLPVLVDNGESIFDSHVIYHYLRQKQGMPEPSIAQHNLISVIDSVNDALIILFMAKNSGLSVGPDSLIFKLQMERIPDSLKWLDQRAEQGAFDAWSYPVIALICLLDWAEFRKLYEFGAYPALLAARNLYSQRKIVLETAPE